ncbi:MAG: hypothetical protein BWY63_00774 [Chloroflexi bacterium ADurb.Bin360]|nr:MAG: hypothetical protein BWY63_00774 [Chloroflexi bacterium ADurb.Bin360]
MLKDRLKELFSAYDPSIQRIIHEVGELEQQYIAMERPRVKEQIDEIITRLARQQLERDETEDYEIFHNGE